MEISSFYPDLMSEYVDIHFFSFNFAIRSNKFEKVDHSIKRKNVKRKNLHHAACLVKSSCAAVTNT